jgi:dephospho-CoA kinase
MPNASHQNRLIVGIIGGAASGKDTVAEEFARRGFAHISSSDQVRQEIGRRGQTTSRALQTEVANELRQAHGIGYWVDLALDSVPTEAPSVAISGLYSPGEGEHLVRNLGGSLVAVVAGEGDDSNLRFDRLQARASGTRDNLSREEFMAAHARECGGAEIHETNLDVLMTMARYTIHNTAGLEYLRLQVRIAVDDLERTSL